MAEHRSLDAPNWRLAYATKQLYERLRATRPYPIVPDIADFAELFEDCMELYLMREREEQFLHPMPIQRIRQRIEEIERKMRESENE